jgi:PhzF family phenazine biosynthesis protein
MAWAVTIVDACLRGESVGALAGGSPTAVVDDDPAATDAQRAEVPVRAGTSHAAFLGPVGADGARAVRFFTPGRELTGCGHGTVAAHAVLLRRAGTGRLRSRQFTGGRTFVAVAHARGPAVEVWFDQGTVRVWSPTDEERSAVLAALGLAEGEVVVASPGTPRYLVRVPDRSALRSLSPDSARVAALGGLGCFVYVPPADGTDTAAARMFAPAIGVPEDIANANSTGCLAAHLGTPLLRVDQGDTLGCPSTVLAACGAEGPDGIRIRVGGLAAIRTP